MKIVSVIIPVYNAEYVIDGCLNSVLHQTYKYLDIVLINDGSTDNSEAVIQKYQQEDKRIRYFCQENSGVSSARNHGLMVSTGQYIMFVDSDDQIKSDCIQKMLELAESTGADITQCVSEKIYDDGKKVSQVFSTRCSGLLSRKEAMTDYIITANPLIGYAVWGKLIKKETIGDLRFSDKRNHEDVEFTASLIDRTTNIYFINEALYLYYVHGTGLSHKSYNMKKVMDCLDTSKSIILLLTQRSEYSLLVDRALDSQLISQMAIIRDLVRENQTEKNEMMKYVMNELRISSRNHKFHDFPHRVMLVICRLSPHLFTILFDVIGKK